MNSLNRRTFTSLLLAAPLAGASGARAQTTSPPIYMEDGIAIDGSDTVAYFDGNGPVAGSAAHETQWQGAIWRFASAENRNAFEAEPEAFAPQFGGYCAWAVAHGYIASTDPRAWSLYEGRLYLNYSRRWRRRWEEDIPHYVALGEANWPAVLSG